MSAVVVEVQEKPALTPLEWLNEMLAQFACSPFDEFLLPHLIRVIEEAHERADHAGYRLEGQVRLSTTPLETAMFTDRIRVGGVTLLLDRPLPTPSRM